MKLFHLFHRPKPKPKPKKNGVPVRDLYNGWAAQEYVRTTKTPHNALEFETTEYFYKKYLTPGMKILDAGGGPGRYTVELAHAGYHMTLMDISDKELEYAREKIRENNVGEFVDAVDCASITKMPYADNSFDMVLCLGGPVSHLKTAAERRAAIRELVRVAKPGAPIFVSVMARPAVLNLLTRDWQGYIEDYGAEYKFWAETETMAYDGDDNWFVGCSYAHFFMPSELRELVTKSVPGARVLHMVALEWSAQNCHAEYDALVSDPVRREKWMDIHFKLAEHPDMQGLSAHTLIVFQKPKRKGIKK